METLMDGGLNILINLIKCNALNTPQAKTDTTKLLHYQIYSIDFNFSDCVL